MKNCLILGSGRSGTSMLGGILHQAGYFMGDKLYRPRESNPRGFFEWKEINGINEDILSFYGGGFTGAIKKKVLKKHSIKSPGKNQRWLLSLPPHVPVTYCDTNLEKRIKTVIQREPFCYKDPRFSYTLPVWRRFLGPGTVFICIFRDPGVTVESILKECGSREYLADLSMNAKSAYSVWRNVYSRILSYGVNTNGGSVRAHARDCFFFLHYNQVYDGTALPALANVLGVELHHDFVDKELNRTIARDSRPVPADVRKIYGRLCAAADYTPVDGLGPGNG